MKACNEAWSFRCCALLPRRLIWRNTCVVQTRMVPKYADDARRPASNEWKDATMNGSNAISGVDYQKLNATLARYFHNSTLVQNAKTQAIVVTYKVCSQLQLV